MVTPDLIGYLKLTFLNSISPLISVTMFDVESLGSIDGFLWRIPKTGPSACDPFTMSGVTASVSATASAVTD